MVLSLDGVARYYGKNGVVKALDLIDLSVDSGDFLGIMGPSGSGKTTLLNIIATIDSPTLGNIRINGTDPSSLSFGELSCFRRRELGVVFQDYNLIDSLSVAENMSLPMILDKKGISQVDKRIKEVSDILGINGILNKMPYEISGGEAQRAAIGRAIFNSPSLLLADEPTGNLDSKSSANVMQLFSTINSVQGVTTLLVTHDPQAASYCKRVVFIRDGKLYNQIERGDSQKRFFNEILDMLSFLNSAN